jgi:hypothetical protein
VYNNIKGDNVNLKKASQSVVALFLLIAIFAGMAAVYLLAK